MTAIQRGDEAAYTIVYDTLRSSLHRVAIRITHSHALADDVVQDVFARLWRRRETWVVRDTIAACLHRAVRNRALDMLRRERRKRPPLIPPSMLPRGTLADDAVHVGELTELLAQLLHRLSPRHRDVLFASLDNDLTYAQIGARLGIARNTVRVNLIEARRRLYRGLLELGVLEPQQH